MVGSVCLESISLAVCAQEREVTIPEGQQLLEDAGESQVPETGVWVLRTGVTLGCLTMGWDDGRHGFLLQNHVPNLLRVRRICGRVQLRSAG